MPIHADDHRLAIEGFLAAVEVLNEVLGDELQLFFSTHNGFALGLSWLYTAPSFLFKPILSANHNWAMARGVAILKLELARRRATTPENAAHIRSPTMTYLS